MLTPTRLSSILVFLAIMWLVAGCGSPTSATPTILPITPTSIPLSTASPPPTQTTNAQLASQIDAFLTDLTDQDRFSGSVLVAMDGQVVISQGYGMANLELEVPNTPQTKFLIASITKQFTAMAILQLQQQGKLNVQDPICQYLLDCPEAWQPITLHHLLTHTSGIPDYYASLSVDIQKHSLNPTDLMNLIPKSSEFSPGERFHYSNSGYVLLGYIVEQVSGQPYALFLQQNIFKPLQMADTGYDTTRAVIKNRAGGYMSATTNAEYFDPSVLYAAGGLYSTVEDLFRWDQALYGDQLLSQPLRDEMFTSFASIPPDFFGWRLSSDEVTDASYGYGWFIGERLNRKWTAHSGSIYGFTGVIERYPDDKVVIIVLSNREARPVFDITSEIARMIFGENGK
jgi:CubicO group peptidase (beta-lactamase class C family)